METNILPSVLIITTSEHLNWQKLITGIVNTNTLPECVSENSILPTTYNAAWSLENKYYKANVQLVVLKTGQWSEHLVAIRETAEAIILYWDNSTQNAAASLDEVVVDLSGFQPEVCLLVCDSFTSHSKFTKQQATEWCVLHGWELIDLQAGPSDEDEQLDEQELLTETYSYDRVREALHANTWSNMLQNGPSNAAPAEPNILYEDAFLGVPEDNSTSGPEEEEDDFEELFAKFSDLKVTADQMSRDERLDYAEGIAMAFLDAIGDDDEYDITPTTKNKTKKLNSKDVFLTCDISNNESNVHTASCEEFLDCDVKSSLKPNSGDPKLFEVNSMDGSLSILDEDELGFTFFAAAVEAPYTDDIPEVALRTFLTDTDAKMLDLDPFSKQNSNSEEFLKIRSYEDIEQEFILSDLKAAGERRKEVQLIFGEESTVNESCKRHKPDF